MVTKLFRLAGLSRRSSRHRSECRPILSLSVAVVAAAGFVGGIASADAAAPLYWPGSSYNPGIYDDLPPPPPQRRVRPARDVFKAEKAAEKLAAKQADHVGKPQAPLVIAISLDRQTMKVYDANGFFSETPVSTGSRGHSTPMGVFSVIQKNKWHRSNLYSDAPMPFMQRITWSGVAMHAGVLPGYPASHGCIRMPTGFALKMWGWTRMGARVVITPGEISPVTIEHALLAGLKPVTSMPVAADAPTPPITPTVVPPPAQATRTADASGGVLSAGAASPIPSIASDKSSADGASAPAAPAALAAKRNGAVALFISRKDGKLYVRQNFAPLFDVPVTIADRDRPFGTHVFTARRDSDESKPVQWTVVSLPAIARSAELSDTDDRAARRRKAAGAIDMKQTPPLASASEALDRITIPDGGIGKIRDMIGDALLTGSSLIVSDQGIAAGETGEGTDFIIRLR